MFCFNEFAFTVKVKHKINSKQILGFILICLYFTTGHFHTCVVAHFPFNSRLSFQRLCRLLWGFILSGWRGLRIWFEIFLDFLGGFDLNKIQMATNQLIAYACERNAWIIKTLLLRMQFNAENCIVLTGWLDIVQCN